MKLILQKLFLIGIFFALGFLISGCTTKSHARLEEQKAFLQGQNQALRQMQTSVQTNSSVTVIGPVEHSQVPWVAGLTLAQALATANYLNPNEPEIIITRKGESANLSAQDVLRGTDIPLEPGDVIELRPKQ